MMFVSTTHAKNMSNPLQAFGPVFDEIYMGFVSDVRLRGEIGHFRNYFGRIYNPALFNCQFFVLSVAKRCRFEEHVKGRLPMGNLWKVWILTAASLHWSCVGLLKTLRAAPFMRCQTTKGSMFVIIWASWCVL